LNHSKTSISSKGVEPNACVACDEPADALNVDNLFHTEWRKMDRQNPRWSATLPRWGLDEWACMEHHTAPLVVVFPVYAAGFPSTAQAGT
jgi:hypothetical protein